MFIKSPLEIWKALEKKYNNERQGTDRFLIINYFAFKITNNQIHKLQVPVNMLHDLNVIVHESLQVGTIISKMPSTWNYYRKKFLQRQKILT